MSIRTPVARGAMTLNESLADRSIGIQAISIFPLEKVVESEREGRRNRMV